MADIKALAEELVNLTVKDVQELAQILKEEYGIEPAAAAAVVVAGPAAGAAEAEQTEFDVILKSAGAAKLDSVLIFEDLCELLYIFHSKVYQLFCKCFNVCHNCIYLNCF